jgi:hypothetical protein
VVVALAVSRFVFNTRPRLQFAGNPDEVVELA